MTPPEHNGQMDLSSIVSAAAPAVFWTDRPDAPEVAPRLEGRTTADLVIIGSGFTGMWAALQAAEADPGRHIIVLEAEVAGFGASTRNGGFCEASLTHGLYNGLAHWPKEIATLNRMGHENLRDLLDTVDRFDIDASAERTGQISFASKPWQVADLREGHELSLEHGESSEYFDEAGARSLVKSPTYLAASWDRDGAVMVDPGLLAWGLRRACASLGVVFHDHSRVRGIEAGPVDLDVRTDDGSASADRVLVATNAWAEPEKAIRNFVIPIYDHVLMTEPLSAEQMASIGWEGRQGLADSGSQFLYYRLTSDDRILWGGYDANYYKGNGMGPEFEQRVQSHELIAGHFFETFPQLEGLGFSHRWAGPIGTTSKFTAAFGSKYDRRLAWVAGYTGLGVGASRWGARVGLDLVDGLDTERTQLTMVRRKPMPFPPEPIRNAVIQFTRGQLAKSDANNGRQGLWLRALDKIGVGFDS